MQGLFTPKSSQDVPDTFLGTGDTMGKKPPLPSVYLRSIEYINMNHYGSNTNMFVKPWGWEQGWFYIHA